MLVPESDDCHRESVIPLHLRMAATARNTESMIKRERSAVIGTPTRPDPSPEPGAVLAELREATKRFGTRASAVEAVSGVDLTVRAGEILAVLGPNGAGKTTAISMLTGLRRPTSGTALLFGRDARDLAARRRVGVMLQASGVPDTLRVRELLNEFRGYYPDPLPLAAVIAAASLDELEHRLYGELSGGQQRRVLFAIAICGNPELLFLDEPTTGLDVDVRRDQWSTLRELKQRAPRSFSPPTTSKKPMHSPIGSSSSTAAGSSPRGHHPTSRRSSRAVASGPRARYGRSRQKASAACSERRETVDGSRCSLSTPGPPSASCSRVTRA